MAIYIGEIYEVHIWPRRSFFKEYMRWSLNKKKIRTIPQNNVLWRTNYGLVLHKMTKGYMLMSEIIFFFNQRQKNEFLQYYIWYLLSSYVRMKSILKKIMTFYHKPGRAWSCAESELQPKLVKWWNWWTDISVFIQYIKTAINSTLKRYDRAALSTMM